MQRVRIASLISTTSAIGLTTLLLAACSEPTNGGQVAAEGGASATPSGGSSQSSSQTAQGGKTQSSKGNTTKASEGGASDTTDTAEGGSSNGGEGGATDGSEGGSSAVGAKGGTSQVSKGGSSQGPKGGTTSKDSTTKAAGGTGAAGGSGSKAAGGTSSAKGGASPKGGASSTGGASSSSTSTSSSTCTAEEEKFSFFLASQAALVKLSGNADGFGGDLGGLTGADKICQDIADEAVTCDRSQVKWRAFLSTKDANAKDRIGKGPWYDRRGRILAKTLTDVLKDRPAGADSAIVNDFPNENGVSNHSPEGKQVDNHQIITGTGTDGNVYKQNSSGTTGGGMMGGGFGGADACLETWTVEAATCKGWTTKEPVGCPRVGHSWPAMSGTNWMSVWNESGCAPGGTTVEEGGTDNSRKIGSAGGYGGFYCFAVTGE